MLVAGWSLGCASDDAIARRRGGRSPFLLPSSPLAPPPPPILPFPVFPLWQHVKDLYRGKRLEKGNEVKFIFCRNIFLSGSMPPNSHSIFEEGAVFKSFKIVSEGVFQEEGKVVTLNWFFFIRSPFFYWQEIIDAFLCVHDTFGSSY